MPPHEPDLPAGSVPAARTFSLSSLMLLIALIAVCLAIFRLHVGLGILTVLIVVPALVRTFQAVARRRGRGQTMTTIDKLRAFFDSLPVVIGIELAAYIVLASFSIITLVSLDIIELGTNLRTGMIFRSFGQ